MHPQNRANPVDTELLEQAIDAVAREAGLHLRIDEPEARHGQYYLDAVLKVAGSKVPLAAEVKRWAAQANLGALISQVQALPLNGVLVADYINPNMAEKLRYQIYCRIW